MDRKYKQYEIPPMWDYCPDDMMYYVDSIFKPSVISLTDSNQYQLEPSTEMMMLMGSVTFYHCELYTNELEIVPDGPIRIEYPYGDDELGVPFQNHVGKIKPGKKLFVSPAFLARYCLPSNRFDMNINISEIKSKLYPKHKREVELEHITNLLSGYAESHNQYYILLDKKLYELESIIQPCIEQKTFPENKPVGLLKIKNVDVHDYPIIFTRHDITSEDMIDGKNDCHAICLLSELYDMAEINKKE